jgi:oligopeptide/dipeptide ABC transporter ATP-binding protein
MPEPVLSIRDLTVDFHTDDGVVHAVGKVSYDIHPGETLGVVGESGSGKSVTVLAILGLISQPPGRIVSGQAIFKGQDLLTLREEDLRRVRGNDLAMIFQDPMTSLNPVFRIGDQIREAIQAHDSTVEDGAARNRSIELLQIVGVPHAEDRYDQYPHEFSGGMRQRAMIAMAIANSPSVLIADEPTTALDVTIQAQILEVLKAAQKETQAATILITHDLGLIAEMADRVVVMYAGGVVETGDVQSIFHEPRHPYTVGLMNSLPGLSSEERWLRPIPGQPPSLINIPSGCPFHPRCFLSRRRERCFVEVPALRPMGSREHLSACHFGEELRGTSVGGDDVAESPM